MQADAFIKPAKLQNMLAENRRLRSVEKQLSIINEFSVAISDLNTVEEIIWAIAQHPIAQLDFEDCVVYILDTERNVLVQKAAYGPKNPERFEIKDPIEIPLGQGIVGSVAESGVSERITDTRKDPRYIIDDEVRFSELAVPIVFEGKVLGVIDSEHREVGFFTQRQEHILQTIASLAAPRIAFIEASKKRLMQSDAEVVRKNSELQNALACLQKTHGELVAAKGLTEQVSQAKSEFIYSMSHQLRTPLNSIIGYSEMLIEDLSDSVDKTQLIEDVNRIELAGRQLLDLINNLIQISDISLDDLPPDQ